MDKYIHILKQICSCHKVAIHIKWSDTDRWKHMIIRPGGMHTLMSFIGCIGTIMPGTGLQKGLGASFKGVPNMINGKVWQKALRGMRMIVTVMMEVLVEVANYDVEQIQVCLEKATEHPNGRLWVDCFITPVFIAHLYLRATKWRLVIAPVLSEEDVMLFLGSSSLELC